MKKRVAVLILGRGSNMTALMKRPSTRLSGEIVVVGRPGRCSARPRPPGRHRHRAYQSHDIGKDREAFEHALDAELQSHRIEIVCLAGFAAIDAMVHSSLERRVVDIHPALLPHFKGSTPIVVRSKPAPRNTAQPSTLSASEWMRGPVTCSARFRCRQRHEGRPCRTRAQSSTRYTIGVRLVAEGRTFVTNPDRFRTSGVRGPPVKTGGQRGLQLERGRTGSVASRNLQVSAESATIGDELIFYAWPR